MVVVEVIPRVAGGGDAGTHSGDDLVVRIGSPPPPGAAPTPADSGAPPVHVVLAGETLQSIAELRLGDRGLAGELARLNGLDDPDEIHPGQVLRLR